MSTVHIKTQSAPVRAKITLSLALRRQYETGAQPCAVQVECPDYTDALRVFKVVRTKDGRFLLHDLKDPLQPARWSHNTTVYKDSIVPLHLAEVLVPVVHRAVIDDAIGKLLKDL